MNEEWRMLLYPLGFISAFAFGSRFIVQWIKSEIKGRSIVPPIFWQFSLLGNVSLVIHGFIQMQFHVCLIQGISAVIAWRNLNLMQTKRAPVSLEKTFLILFFTCLCIILAFSLRHFFLFEEDAWFRIPLSPWQKEKIAPVSTFWHLIGFIGYTLFSSRFWVQWWYAEKMQKSYLPLSFWWLSLIGAVASDVYFLRIADIVNFIGPTIGLIPYIRNIMLLNRSAKIKSEA